MRGSLEELTTPDVHFWQEREKWSVFYHVQKSALEDLFRKMDDPAFT